MQKITPFLWFDKNAEEAMNFYVDVFSGNTAKKSPSKIVSIMRYPTDMQVGPVPDMGGKVLTGIFELDDQRFMALDGGPFFKFTEATSFFVECKDQTEIDYFWWKMSAVPKFEQCGWLKDKYGLSWQIIPKNIFDLISTKEGMNSMLKMKKIVIADLEKAGK